MRLINPELTFDHSLLILADPSKHQSTESIKNALEPIVHLIDKIQTFLVVDDCVEYLGRTKNERISLIIDINLYEQDTRLCKIIESSKLIVGVYILSFDPNKTNVNGQMTKVKGNFQDIRQICHAIEYEDQLSMNRSTKTSLIVSNGSSDDEIDSSFIYSKLLTRVIVHLEYDDDSRRDFFNFLIEKNLNNPKKCEQIREFDEYYTKCPALWWYTRESFIHPLVNDSFITHNYMTIIKMGFFIQDLYRSIVELYQSNDNHRPMKVFRGQSMSKFDFDDLKQREGGLYGFPNFLSTSFNSKVALQFAHYAENNPALVGILFEIDVDPSNTLAPFAILTDQSFANGEEEVLFFPHTIFRIGKFEKTDKDLWKVQLTLTNDENKQRNLFFESIENEVIGVSAWIALGIVLYRMGAFQNAIKTFEHILRQSDDRNTDEFGQVLGICYNDVGVVHHSMENYSEAMKMCKDALRTLEILKHRDSKTIAGVYENIGMIHYALGDHNKALKFCQKSLTMKLTAMNSNAESLFTSYSNLSKIYEYKGDYATSLSYCKQAETIERTRLCQDHPMLTTTYNNFGRIYALMGDYSLSLSFYQKTLDIYAIFLPNSHPLLAMAYNNVGYLNQLLGDYAAALYYYEKAIELHENLETNHLSRATFFINIAVIYRLIDQYPKALQYQEKALKIQNECLAENHSSIAVTYNNIGVLHHSMRQFSDALTNYEKSLRIWLKILPETHPNLAILYNNIGTISDSLGNYEKARSSYEKSLEILQTSSITNPMHLATIYNNIGEIDRIAGQYQRALSFYEKSFEIEKKILPENHPSLAITLINIAVVFENQLDFSKAIENATRAFLIFSHVFEPDHHQVKNVQRYLTELRLKIEKNV